MICTRPSFRKAWPGNDQHHGSLGTLWTKVVDERQTVREYESVKQRNMSESGVIETPQMFAGNTHGSRDSSQQSAPDVRVIRAASLGTHSAGTRAEF
jgi:hypothetical protein